MHREDQPHAHEEVTEIKSSGWEVLGGLSVSKTITLGGQETEVPILMTTSETAALLDVSRRTLINWIKRNKIPSIRLPGGEYRVPLGLLISRLNEEENTAQE
jgi:excisionase family DNA binding protein